MRINPDTVWVAAIGGIAAIAWGMAIRRPKTQGVALQCIFEGVIVFLILMPAISYLQAHAS